MISPNAPWHLPPLATSVVGSYSVPEWLQRLKTEFYQGRISAAHLTEIHEAVIKAAVKVQELAGIDVVSDGELRRDNDVDYFLARVPGVRLARRAKRDFYDYHNFEVSAPLLVDDTPADTAVPAGGAAPLDLAADFAFTRALTDRLGRASPPRATSRR